MINLRRARVGWRVGNPAPGECQKTGVGGVVATEAFASDGVATSVPSLLSAVAHELRAPLAALATSSGVLVDGIDELDRREVRGVAAGILRRTLWLQELVENLLSAAVIGDGRLRLAPMRVRLDEIIDRAILVIEPSLEMRRQRVRVRVARDLGELTGDANRIAQVVVNLLSNASKFSPPGSAIDISAKRHDRAARVTVADRGPGIDDDEAERLFDAFYRGRNRAGAEGVGLGLAVVRSIVAAHGGTVGARNRAGGGARFWFDLPHARDEERSETRRERHNGELVNGNGQGGGRTG